MAPGRKKGGRSKANTSTASTSASAAETRSGPPPKKKFRKTEADATAQEPDLTAETSQDSEEGGEVIGTRVLACGSGNMSQLGHGPNGRQHDIKPRKLATFPDGTQFRQIAAGGLHSVALTKDGKVYTWGCNDDCPLGRECPEDTDEDASPAVVHFDDADVKIVQVAAGDTYTAALTTNGSVYAWGGFRDKSTMAGLDVQISKNDRGREVKNLLQKQNRPLLIFDHEKRKETVKKIAGGGNHLCLLTKKGKLYTLGAGDCGQLGRINGHFLSDEIEPDQRVRNRWLKPDYVGFGKLKIKKVVDVWAGSYWTFCVGSSEKQKRNVLLAFGLNNYEQLGVERRETMISQPTEAVRLDRVLPEGSVWKEFFGDHHVLGLTSCGRVFGIGRNDDFLLGQGSDQPEKQTEPVQIKLGKSRESDITDAAGISCATKASFCWTRNGEGYAWGNNNDGELGLGLDEDSRVKVPTRIQSKHLINEDIGEKFEIVQISAGGQHTLFLARETANE